ncbi:amidohydrolase [Roseomonas sp. 18066]|uniref:amidohydrolase n=1 Tax=Roseomonas sp. 18066 TaxID=2681412 RepID=UPI001356CDBA|nr:amidohydrolase [Roseomonas sp. 18066]
MTLTRQDLLDIAAWRQRLHRRPELSGAEVETAAMAAGFLREAGAAEVITGLGGHGVAGIFPGAAPGPTVLFRAELDGLPILEASGVPHASEIAGRAHSCGHDGHMAILAGLARALGRQAPARGRAVILYQPAEEDGSGAAAVIADPRFSAIAPDLAFACHNMPGIALGAAAIAEGPANCASAGLRIVLSGRTAHASAPETGTSPMQALARLMPGLTALGRGGPLDAEFSLVTVTHATLGEACFGVAPGQAELWCTLRTLTDNRMAALRAAAEALAREAAEDAGLGLAIDYRDVFDHCDNAPEATAHWKRALDAEGVPHDTALFPMRASEDFGRFGQRAPAAMVLLGSGIGGPALHNPEFDYPDALTDTGARVFIRLARDLLG